MRYLLPLLLLLLTLGVSVASASNPPGGTGPADIWSDRGGRGLNQSCGRYRVGEEVTLYFEVSGPMYVELYVIRPDGSTVELMNVSMAGPGVIYRTPPMLLVDEGPRLVRLVGARSHQVLDSCRFYVVREILAGDVWTDAGGRGENVSGGSFPPLVPVRVSFTVNSTADVELVAESSRGGQVLYRGRVEAGEVKHVYMEAVREGRVVLRLVHGNETLDTCEIIIRSLEVEEASPPILEVDEVRVSGLRVELEGRVEPGTPNSTVSLVCDWGDGSREENASFPLVHTYRRGGTYRMRLVARQSDGLSSNFTYTVKVAPPPPPKTTPLGGATGSPPPRSASPQPSTVTKVVTVTPEGGRSKTADPALAFVLGSAVALISFLLISKALGRGSGAGEAGES